ncbi:MAG TPA: tetratricopeptide repeat protein, partial [Anaerovoracaceae bacterium]|nr:tetratricopeptide repeat protein [Anaerovoracaceae bacterium]
MKKIITLIWFLIFTVTVIGQQAVEYILKARALVEAGKPDLAIDILSGAIAVAKDSRLYIERAEAKMAKGDYQEAINDFNEANKIIPSSGEYGLSKIYSLKGDAGTALYHLEINLSSPFRKGEKEIMLDPAFGSIENSSGWRQFWKKERYSNIERGISEIEYYISVGKTDESKEVLSDLKKSYQSDDAIVYAESLINLSAGKYNEVIRIINGLLVLNPENEKYLRILAKAQTGASNPAGASVTYTRLLGIGVADAELLIRRAECYRKTGETDKALADIEDYLEIYPENKAAIS